MKYKRTPGARGPSSAIGIMRFFDTEAKGPRLTPEFVIGVGIVFSAFILAAKYIFL